MSLGHVPLFRQLTRQLTKEPQKEEQEEEKEEKEEGPEPGPITILMSSYTTLCKELDVIIEKRNETLQTIEHTNKRKLDDVTKIRAEVDFFTKLLAKVAAATKDEEMIGRRFAMLYENEMQIQETFPVVLAVYPPRYGMTNGVEIGKGGYGKVYKVMDRLKQQYVAIKKVDTLATKNPEKTMQQTIQETKILARLEHGPNIARLVSSFRYQRSATTLYIAMELCTGGNLFKVLEGLLPGRLEELDAKKITKQLLEAVAYCHEQKIAHLDIKPENIMLANEWKNDGDPFPDIKLIDFGLASTFETMTACSDLKVPNCDQKGTPEYIAPEVTQRKYNGKADIWSIGCVLYKILNGRTAFEWKTDARGKEVRGYELEVSEERVGDLKFYSHVAQEFIRYLLTYDYKERPDAAQALEDDWLIET